MQKFLKIFRKSANNELVHLTGSYFGKNRAEIISILDCEMKMYTVVPLRQNCSTELQVWSPDDNSTMYINPVSRLVQPTGNIIDCTIGDLGNVYEVEDQNGQKVNIIQNQNILRFTENVQTSDDVDLYGTKMNFTMEFKSFSKAGLYDKEYLDARNAFILQGQTYATIQSGVTRALVSHMENKYDAASGEFNFLDAINYDELWSVIFDFSWLSGFFDVVSYIACVKFLLVDCFWFAVQLFWLGRWQEIRENMARFRRRRRGRAPVQRRRRQEYDQAEWDDAIELNAIRRIENELAPPPYE